MCVVSQLPSGSATLAPLPKGKNSLYVLPTAGCAKASVVKLNDKLINIIAKKITFFSAVFWSPLNTMGVCHNMIQPFV
jgi:hypothetical protein